MTNPIANYGKSFRASFDRLCYGRSWQEVFRDFVEIGAATLHQQPYHVGLLEKDEDYERIEQLYLATIKRYSKEQIEHIVSLFGITILALQEGREDFLGEQYMQLGISNKHNGEFFTPMHVSRMMAQMTLHDIGDLVKAKGYVTLSEPACGAGGMVIEAARTLQEQGHDPRNAMLFQAVDINRTCFNMAYLQFSALELPGEVIHGNTISMESWEKRSTPQWKLMQKYGVSSMLIPPFERPEPAHDMPPPKAQKSAQIAFDF